MLGNDDGRVWFTRACLSNASLSTGAWVRFLSNLSFNFVQYKKTKTTASNKIKRWRSQMSDRLWCKYLLCTFCLKMLHIVKALWGAASGQKRENSRGVMLTQNVARGTAAASLRWLKIALRQIKFHCLIAKNWFYAYAETWFITVFPCSAKKERFLIFLSICNYFRDF